MVALSPAGSGWLAYDAEAVAGGQLWRLVTCHLTHLGTEHRLWDVAVLAVLGWLIEGRNRAAMAICTVGSAVAIGVAILVAAGRRQLPGRVGRRPALLAFLAVTLLREAGRRASRHAGRRGRAAARRLRRQDRFELHTGRTPFVDAHEGFVPVPLAHAVGAAVGGALAGLNINVCQCDLARRNPCGVGDAA